MLWGWSNLPVRQGLLGRDRPLLGQAPLLRHERGHRPHLLLVLERVPDQRLRRRLVVVLHLWLRGRRCVLGRGRGRRVLRGRVDRRSDGRAAGTACDQRAQKLRESVAFWSRSLRSLFSLPASRCSVFSALCSLRPPSLHSARFSLLSPPLSSSPLFSPLLSTHRAERAVRRPSALHLEGTLGAKTRRRLADSATDDAADEAEEAEAAGSETQAGDRPRGTAPWSPTTSEARRTDSSEGLWPQAGADGTRFGGRSESQSAGTVG